MKLIKTTTSRHFWSICALLICMQNTTYSFGVELNAGEQTHQTHYALESDSVRQNHLSQRVNDSTSGYAGRTLDTTCASTLCNYTIRMRDSFGDGWNNAIIQVEQNNYIYSLPPFTDGYGPLYYNFNLCPNQPFHINCVNDGQYPTEIILDLFNDIGQLVYTIGPGVVPGTAILFSDTTQCQGATYGLTGDVFLSGKVFSDTNMNSMHDSGEGSGATFGTINIFGSGYGSVITPDSLGDFALTIPAGTYTLEMCPNQNYYITLPSGGNLNCRQYTFTVYPNDTLTGLFFAITDSLVHVCGTLYADFNGNGILDNGEPGIPNLAVSINGIDYLSNNTGEYCASFPAGQITIDSSFPAHYSSLPVQPTLPLSLVINGTTGNLPDIGLELPTGINDMTATLLQTGGRLRPGWPSTWSITICNLGEESCGGVVALNYDTDLQITSFVPSPDSINTSANWAYFHVDSLAPFTCSEILFTGAIATNVPMGTMIRMSASIVSDCGSDYYPQNDTSFVHEPVINSFDPNDKTVVYTNTGNNDFHFPDAVSADQVIRYRIRFQNTGTAEAIHILVTDTLSAFVDPATFVFQGSSHTPTVTRNGNIVSYWFPEIWLPDSNANEPGSHGYIYYQVEALSGITPGTVITDHAAIYFDFNEPVVTNDAILTVVVPTALESMQTNTLRITPNPASRILLVVLSNQTSASAWSIHNLHGQIIKQGAFAAGQSQITVEEVPQGSYILQVAGYKPTRFVIIR